MIQTTTFLLDFIFHICLKNGSSILGQLWLVHSQQIKEGYEAAKETLNCAAQLAKLSTRLTGLSTNSDSESETEMFCLSAQKISEGDKGHLNCHLFETALSH